MIFIFPNDSAWKSVFQRVLSLPYGGVPSAEYESRVALKGLSIPEQRVVGQKGCDRM